MSSVAVAGLWELQQRLAVAGTQWWVAVAPRLPPALRSGAECLCASWGRVRRRPRGAAALRYGSCSTAQRPAGHAAAWGWVGSGRRRHAGSGREGYR